LPTYNIGKTQYGETLHSKVGTVKGDKRNIANFC
jgi:hypothetical protein